MQGIKTMNALEVSQRAIDAWNRHDADALVALYAEGGTYETPRVDHALTGQAIGDFAKSVAYPLALFTQVEGDKIRSERVYFDRQTAAEQLGLKAK
jgi:ketosteroid isomerase-like protein